LESESAVVGARCVEGKCSATASAPFCSDHYDDSQDNPATTSTLQGKSQIKISQHENHDICMCGVRTFLHQIFSSIQHIVLRKPVSFFCI